MLCVALSQCGVLMMVVCFVLAANAVLLVVSRLLDAVCHQDGTCAFLSKTRYLQILISLEVVIALALLIVYLGQCLVQSLLLFCVNLDSAQILISLEVVVALALLIVYLGQCLVQ